MSERTEALLRTAVAAHQADRPEEALLLYREVLLEEPRDFRALHLGGAAAFQAEMMEEAASLLGAARRLKPGFSSTLICYGLACAGLGRDAEAEENLKAGLALDARNPEAWLNLGGFLISKVRNGEAVRCFQRALELRPGYAPALAGLGEAAKSEGRAADAIGPYRKALDADPGNASARLGLVQALQSCNRLEESLAQCDLLLEMHPGNSRAASSRLFLLNYLSSMSAGRLFSEHEAYGCRFPPAAPRAFPNAPDPSRRLRIAFLSPDLRAHSVAFFLEPLLRHLDPASFEVALYHDHVRVDGVTEALRGHAAIWRNFAGRSDATAEAAIRADAPDVIVDLAGHSGQNRMPLFAKRVAPVQVTYLGYPNTTGLAEMDYRFTDAEADPPGNSDRFSTERLVRFSPCAWAYAPSEEVRAVGSVPCAGLGPGISFGSFNNLCKVNVYTLALWRDVLGAVPGSRLVLKGFGIDPGRMHGLLGSAGIDPARVSILQPTRDIPAHLAAYAGVDIALDPFPYGGTTTTCEALWMGRPVVTLAGDRHSSRVGASLLAAVGRAEWVARSRDDYVRVAAGLASDRTSLREASSGLRGAMAASPLMDHARQAARFGDAIRECWGEWCARGAEAGLAQASA